MRKQEIDFVLTRMLDAYSSVSDLNITVGKPFQVESAGQLVGVDIDPPFEELTPFQTEVFSLNLIDGDRRLTETLIREGSCDSAYALPGKARFRVNIFAQRNMYSAVLRQLSTKIPSCKDCRSLFTKWHRRKTALFLSPAQREAANQPLWPRCSTR